MRYWVTIDNEKFGDILFEESKILEEILSVYHELDQHDYEHYLHDRTELIESAAVILRAIVQKDKNV